MIISSEKANKRVRRIVDFASRHRWAKYPGIAAVSVVYGADWLRAVTVETGNKIRESMNAPFRPLAGRAASAFLAAAFAFMAVPVGFTAGAEEMDGADLPPVAGESVWGSARQSADKSVINDGADNGTDAAYDAVPTAEEAPEAINEIADTAADTIADTAADTADSENTAEEAPARKRVTRERTRPKRQWMARTAEEIAGRVTLEGLPEKNEGYGITLNVEKLGRDVTAKFTSRRDMLDDVRYCFECYDIPTDNLYIAPVDVTIYSTDDRTVLQFKEDKNCSADITFPVPEQFDGHTDDLKVVRLDDGNRMTVLDCEITESENGRTLTFNTEHFSVFAMIAYRQLPSAASPEEPEVTENIGSGAPVTAGGVQASAAVSTTISPFDEDKRRFGRKPNRKRVYRIKRICKEYEKLI
ncbi:MAG: hypothetical protein K2K57_10275 [Oscillospiraceae bacterium]|nr:hypothetical protein [Oscillospiraceae bacterium]